MKYPICCTCAETDSRKYTDRLLWWTGQLSEAVSRRNCELHVFNDGTFPEDKARLEWLGVRIHEFPKLGRPTTTIFPSYKRNFREMCRMFPNGFTLIENDVMLLNREKIFGYMEKPGWLTGFSKKYNFIETAIMVINSPQLIARFRRHYEDEGNLLERAVFENVLHRLAEDIGLAPQIVFTGERREESREYDSSYDYIAQFM